MSGYVTTPVPGTFKRFRLPKAMAILLSAIGFRTRKLAEARLSFKRSPLLPSIPFMDATLGGECMRSGTQIYTQGLPLANFTLGAVQVKAAKKLDVRKHTSPWRCLMRNTLLAVRT